jgi:phage tail sheath gpL-like
MKISFNQIPVDIRTPGQHVEFDASKAVSGLPAAAQKILIIGQKLAAGIATVATPYRIVNLSQAQQLFGRGSMLATMVAALIANNGVTETWAVALDDLLAGNQASGTITFTGPATAAGTLALMIGGIRVPVGVASGNTATQIATATAAAINANADLPVTAAPAAGVVTLTSRHKGTTGNDIDVRVNHYEGEFTPAGVTVAIVSLSGGTGNPDLAAVWAALGDEQYRTIVLNVADATTLTSVETELASRWGPMRQIEGMAYAGVRGSFGTLAAFGATRNSPYVSLIGANLSPTSPWAWAAAYAGLIAYYGSIDPARPFQTLAMAEVMAPKKQSRFTRSERDLLLRDGISTFIVDSGGNVLIERPITTYQTNAFGFDDVAWLDVNTPLTVAYLRYVVRARIAQKFPRYKLAGDDANFGSGQAIVTPKIIRAELIALFRELEDAGLVEDLDQFVNDLIVERDATDKSRVNALIPPNIVNQFRVFAGRIEFRL